MTDFESTLCFLLTMIAIAVVIYGTLVAIAVAHLHESNKKISYWLEEVARQIERTRREP